MKDLSHLFSWPMSHLSAQLHSGRSLLVICEVVLHSWAPTAIKCISVQCIVLFLLYRELVYWQEMRLHLLTGKNYSLPRVQSEGRIEKVY